MKKIIFVTNDSWFFVSHRLPIARHLVENGFQVVVVAKSDDKTTEIFNAGCSFRQWNLSPRGQNVFSELLSILNLAVILWQEKPDIIHLITIKAVLYGGALARLLRITKVVFAISGLGAVLQKEQQGLKSIPIKMLYKFALNNNSSSLIFQNNDNQKDLESYLGNDFKRAWIIPGSGVNLSDYPYTDEPNTKELKVVMACRLLRDKGVQEFVDAASELKNKYAHLNFIVAGEDSGAGNPAAFSTKELEALKQSPHVNFIGHVDNIAKLFSEAHLVVLPSYHEGFPKVLIEAAACGRAVVTTDVPGCRDSIIEGETGLLVQARNSIELAAAIERLVCDSSLRKKMSLAGRHLAESKYSIEDVIATHFTIYNS